MKKILILPLIFLFALSCKDNNNDDDNIAAIVGVVPQEPNYSDDDMWYVDRVDNAAYDVLYFVPTCTAGEIDPVSGEMCYFANVNYSETQRNAMLERMVEGDGIFGVEADFYSPYYRQITAESLKSDEILFTRFNTVSVEDIKSAYRYYMDNINNGRPYALAGYSQGSMSVIAAMGVVSDTELDRLIAAYCVGSPLTAEDMQDTKTIIPAKGAGDVGVTICYNSVSRPESIPSFLDHGTFCINPVNWSTDQTSAEFITPQGDKATAHVDLENSLLIIGGLDEQKYSHPVPEIFPAGCYHMWELSFYAEELTENIKLRAENYFKGL